MDVSDKVRSSVLRIIAGALVVAFANDTSAAGQTVSDPFVRRADTAQPTEPTVSLVQIRIKVSLDWSDAARSQRLATFKSVVPLITSCADADAIANAFGGEVVRNDTLHMSDLPAPLRDNLNGKPIGYPSDIFGSGDDYGVLIRCA